MKNRLKIRPGFMNNEAGGEGALRVLQVISVIAEVYGGPSTVAIEVNRELRRLGVDARVVSSTLSGTNGSTIEPDELARLKTSGALISLFQPSRPWKLQNSWGLVREIIREARRSDLIHIDGQYRIPHYVAFMAATILRVPYTVQPHGTLDPYFRKSSRLGKALFNFATFNCYIRNAERIYFTADSEAIAASDVVRPDQVVVAPLGATLPPASFPVVDVKCLNGIGREKLVLFLGRLAAKKRPDLLIEAWAMAEKPPEAKLVLAGPDDDFSATELRALASKLGVSDSVYFPGQVGGGAKTWFYERCGTFVLASENENFGLTVGEAMLAGCHVISSRGVVASTLLDDAGSGQVIDSMTPKQLASALATALGDRHYLEQSGFRAQRFARDNLGWTSFAQQIRETAVESRRMPRLKQVRGK